ncbi:amino acid permease [Acidisoma cladoniae]|jgi:L-asparagine permease|uniref:amino acid permease n=1 Tax=Acidisoma cladoniae TaxID=3040935 RepID=UPI00254BA177|nr:amino acid permease [Acidisoma sp. PAMC 29798]
MTSPRAQSAIGSTETRAILEAQDAGYEKGLGNRQIQMIAIGGAIGTGLLMGAGKRMGLAGPSLAIVYAICGIFAFFILRALGELAMYRRSSGSFVSYAREFLGEKASYVAGWLYFLNWAMAGIVDITAIALYFKFWPMFTDVPQWLLALFALGVISMMNLTSVKYFGEMEFWFSLIKVVTISAFLVVGVVILLIGLHVMGARPGPHLIAENGGIFPKGIGGTLAIVQGVVFAYAGIELIGTAAGEAKDAEKIMPRAINSVIARIALFYVGSVILLSLLLPYTAYHAGTSPFVTVFASLHVAYIAGIINFVVLTAALSSLNSGLYSTGRVLRSLAMGGSAPRALSVMSRSGVPYGGLLLTISLYLIGVFLNFVIPSEVFEMAISISAIGIVSTWSFIIVCQMKLRQAIHRGEITPVKFKMPFAPVSSWLTLAFLAIVFYLMIFASGQFYIFLVGLPLLAIALVGGWYLTKRSTIHSDMPTVIPSIRLTDDFLNR